MTEHLHIKANLKQVLETLRKLEKKYQRPAKITKLLAVSKTKSIKEILAANSAGQTHFGENYVQEAIEKIEGLKLYKTTLNWHFIGPIQKNKTRLIAENFQWVHSVDRLIIAQRLNEQRPSSLNPLQVCIQVNIDSEVSKSGITIDGIRSLAENLVELRHIKLRGLMAIPKASNNTDKGRAKNRRTDFEVIPK